MHVHLYMCMCVCVRLMRNIHMNKVVFQKSANRNTENNPNTLDTSNQHGPMNRNVSNYTNTNFNFIRKRILSSRNYSQQKYPFECIYLHSHSHFCHVKFKAHIVVSVCYFRQQLFAIQPAKSLKNNRVIISEFTTIAHRTSKKRNKNKKQTVSETRKHE